MTDLELRLELSSNYKTKRTILEIKTAGEKK